MNSTKEQLLSELDATVNDLLRQDKNEGRVRYYSEAKILIKVLVSLGWLSQNEAVQWRADMHAAHQKAIGSCQENGEVVDVHAIEQAAFRLKLLAKDGILPRFTITPPVAKAPVPLLETLLQEHRLGVSPVWIDQKWQWAAHVARLNEPTEWSYGDDPRTACQRAIAAIF